MIVGSARLNQGRPIRIILDRRSPWLLEFAAALGDRADVVGYSGTSDLVGILRHKTSTEILGSPALKLVSFSAQRGMFSLPSWALLSEHRRIAKLILKASVSPESTPLICCYPQYFPIADMWPGPVVYYATDLFSEYSGANFNNIRSAETKLCKRASIICPNSQRVADNLILNCGCDPARILILQNAVRHQNLLAEAPQMPHKLPIDMAQIPRPIAGVIGNMADNVDWVFTERLVQGTPWLSWVFLGPTSASVAESAQRKARESLMKCTQSAHFLGSRPYRDLVHYARAFDLALLPYRNHEPTYSASPTRFFEHLAACRPIIATRGVEQLLHKEPLLRLVGSPEEAIYVCENLKANDFQDGFEALRWRVSQSETWHDRATALIERLGETLGDGNELTYPEDCTGASAAIHSASGTRTASQLESA